MKVLWTTFAIEQLNQIFQYYYDKAGFEVANKIRDSIIDSSDILLTFPQAGREDEMLKLKEKGYRYLVKGNYKTIYTIQNNVVNINDVFDTRQNPKKVLKGK